MKNQRGCFISIEGIDGCGKSTVMEKVIELLNEEFPNKIIFTREPGGARVRVAEAIRNIVLTKEFPEIHPHTEALLFAASRSQHLNQVIKPGLEEGKFVISDRYVDSSFVYQGKVRNIGYENIKKINDFATDGVMPELTLLFDLPASVAMERMNSSRSESKNRIDLEELSFHNRARIGFLELSKDNPKRFVVVDASKPLDVVVGFVYKIIAVHLRGINV